MSGASPSAQSRRLLHDRSDELLPSEARVHRHDKDEVHEREEGAQQFDGRPRVEGETGLGPALPDPGERPVHVPVRLHVNGEDIGPRLEKVVEQPIGVLHHEVDVQSFVGVAHPQPTHEGRAKGDVRDEAAVHDIDMQPVVLSLEGRDGPLHVHDVRREQRRRQKRASGHLYRSCQTNSPPR